MTVTVETLTGRHIEAVRTYAKANGKKTLLRDCERADNDSVDIHSRFHAMAKVAEAYNKLKPSGWLGPPEMP